MKKKINDNRTPYMLLLLKKEFEVKSGIELTSNNHFIDAAVWINNTTGHKDDIIEESTLRNWWQNDLPKHIPFKSKLSSVVECLGYKNWDSFCDIKSRHTTLHSFFDPLELKVESMEVGKSYIVGWFPQYYILVEYIGKYKFRIIDCSSNSKLQVGDEKEIYGFGIVYTTHMDTVYDDLGREYEAEGYPLHPTITIRTSKTKSEQINNDKHSFIHICG